MNHLEYFQLTASSPQDLRGVAADFLLDAGNDSLANSVRSGLHVENYSYDGFRWVNKIVDGDGNGCGVEFTANSYGAGDGVNNSYMNGDRKGFGGGSGDGEGDGWGGRGGYRIGSGSRSCGNGLGIGTGRGNGDGSGDGSGYGVC